MKKLIISFLISCLLAFPSLSYAQFNSSKKMSYGTGVNTLVTATLAASTAGYWNFLTCYRISVINEATATAGVAIITVTINHLNADVIYKVAYTTVVNTQVLDQLCFPEPIRGKNQNTAISFTGHSGDPSVRLSITLWGYEGI